MNYDYIVAVIITSVIVLSPIRTIKRTINIERKKKRCYPICTYIRNTELWPDVWKEICIFCKHINE